MYSLIVSSFPYVDIVCFSGIFSQCFCSLFVPAIFQPPHSHAHSTLLPAAPPHPTPRIHEHHSQTTTPRIFAAPRNRLGTNWTEKRNNFERQSWRRGRDPGALVGGVVRQSAHCTVTISRIVIKNEPEFSNVHHHLVLSARALSHLGILPN